MKIIIFTCNFSVFYLLKCLEHGAFLKLESFKAGDDQVFYIFVTTFFSKQSNFMKLIWKTMYYVRFSCFTSKICTTVMYSLITMWLHLNTKINYTLRMTIQSLKHFQSGIPQDPLVTTLSLGHLRYKIAPLVLICPSPEKKILSFKFGLFRNEKNNYIFNNYYSTSARWKWDGR